MAGGRAIETRRCLRPAVAATRRQGAVAAGKRWGGAVAHHTAGASQEGDGGAIRHVRSGPAAFDHLRPFRVSTALEFFGVADQVVRADELGEVERAAFMLRAIIFVVFDLGQTCAHARETRRVRGERKRKDPWDQKHRGIALAAKHSTRRQHGTAHQHAGGPMTKTHTLKTAQAASTGFRNFICSPLEPDPVANIQTHTNYGDGTTSCDTARKWLAQVGV